MLQQNPRKSGADSIGLTENSGNTLKIAKGMGSRAGVEQWKCQKDPYTSVRSKTELLDYYRTWQSNP